MRVRIARGPRLMRALLIIVPMVAISAVSHATAGGELASSPVIAPLALVGLALSLSALRSWSSVVGWAVVVAASELIFHSLFLGSGAALAAHEEPEFAHGVAALAALVLVGAIVRRFRAVIAQRIGHVRMLWSGSAVEVPAPRPPAESPARPIPFALVSSVARRGPPLHTFA